MGGLEKHLKETFGHDAPDLSGVLIPLQLYADDLIIMSTTAAGLDAPVQYCSNSVTKGSVCGSHTAEDEHHFLFDCE